MVWDVTVKHKEDFDSCFISFHQYIHLVFWGFKGSSMRNSVNDKNVSKWDKAGFSVPFMGLKRTLFSLNFTFYQID